MTNKNNWLKEKLELGEMECQFGLMIREKDNHDNYALINFRDLDEIVKYYDIFKKVIAEK